MDKYEYKIRAEEIRSLIADGKYSAAVKVADSIDWKRVKSVTMLCTISDLYKINRRFQESKEILLMAYNRYPNGRAIVYSLCELSIKMGEFVQAIEYYKEFVRIAPQDTGRYILQYKLYEAQDVTLEERIAVLEELKKHDYRERWAYELAYLYHRVGLTTECVEECDEMFLWFGDGRYVMKALELKALHEPLSPDQQARYDKSKTGVDQKKSSGKKPATDNSQQVSAERGTAADIAMTKTPVKENYGESTRTVDDKDPQATKPLYDRTEITERLNNADGTNISHEDMFNASVAAGDFSNLQKSIGDSVREIMTDLPEQPQPEKIYSETLIATDTNMAIGNIELSPESEAVAEPEATEETEPSVNVDISDETDSSLKSEVSPEQDIFQEKEVSIEQDIVPEKEIPAEQYIPTEKTADIYAKSSPVNVVKPSHYDNMLAQDYDGQISMVVPEDKMIDKQITGQLSIDDIINRIKLDQQKKQMEEVRKHVSDETGNLFAEFDAKTREDIQTRIERVVADAVRKEKSGRGEDKTGPVKEENIIRPDEESAPFVAAGNKKQDNILEELEKQKLSAVDEASEQDEEKVDETATDSEDQTAANEEAEDTDEQAAENEEAEDADEQVAVNEEAEDADEQAAENEEAEDADEQAAENEEADTDVQTEADNATRTSDNQKESGESDTDERIRSMTPEEKKLFGPYINHKKSRMQIINALDNLSMAAYTNNVIVSGDEGTGTISLAMGLIKSVQLSDSNFSGNVAKINGWAMNHKDVGDIIDKLMNGALIIRHASEMKPDTIKQLTDSLQTENKGIIVIIVDNKIGIEKLLKKYVRLQDCFNVRIDLDQLDDETLVAYAKQYAYEKEYTIDNLGILALHTRIDDMQTMDHEVTISEVREIVDDAIFYAEKRSAGHFFDVLFNKRYDDEDMIILREKDFMH